MSNTILVKQDQNTINLYGEEVLVDKDKLAKAGEYTTTICGTEYIIKLRENYEKEVSNAVEKTVKAKKKGK